MLFMGQLLFLLSVAWTSVLAQRLTSFCLGLYQVYLKQPPVVDVEVSSIFQPIM